MRESDYLHQFAAPSRRDFLRYAGGGFGAIALAGMMADEQTHAATAEVAARRPHFFGKARNVIFLFMDGGPSHLDTFDPKPLVNEMAGKPLPKSIKRVITPMGVSENPLLASKRKWKNYGECGMPVSDWYSHVGECADDLCVIRSCTSDALNHVGGVCQMNTGSILAGRPSLGAWVNYGLGSENQNLPGFVVLMDSDREPPGGNRVWGSGFMPATHQGTKFLPGKRPILYLDTPEGISDQRQLSKLGFIDKLNREHLALRPQDTELEARIASYELAYRMQSQAPEAVDLANETQQTQDAYGMNDKRTQAFGQNCLLARRLAERGVRFVQLFHEVWDQHVNLTGGVRKNAEDTDRPSAALVQDLKERGLLQDTLIVWGGEFGRTIYSQGSLTADNYGRDHHPRCFSIFMAGAGIKGGLTHGETDEYCYNITKDPVHVHDLNATILHCMGIDHTRFTYKFQGLDQRLTGVLDRRVISKVLA